MDSRGEINRRGRDLAWGESLRRIAGRDESALAELYDQSSGFVYGLAFRMLQDSADAEEIALDVYKQVWRQSGAFDPGRGSATAWIVALTRSRAIDRIRSKRVRNRTEVPYPDFPLDAAPNRPGESGDTFSSERRLVAQALEALTPDQRDLIERAFFSGLTHSELSKELGLPLGTVKTRIRGAIMTLRELLQPERGSR